MKKSFKDLAACLLLVLMFASPTYAMGNYTVSNTYTESYHTSYPANGYVYCGTMQQVPQNYYPEVAYNNIPPQGYVRQINNTQTFRDERPEIDKNIERGGKIVGILGGAAVLGLGIAALICSF